MFHNVTTFRMAILPYFPQNSSLNLTDEELYPFLEHYRSIYLQTANITTPIPTAEDVESFECGGEYLETMATQYAEYYHPYCSIIVCIFGTIANILNIIVLTRREMSNIPINRILTMLAITDMLLMIEYIPFAYYYHLELLGKRDFPYYGAVLMLFHNHVTQVLHTTSICLTLTLAIWRYLAIGYPQKNQILCSDRRCNIAIAISCILPSILCMPTYTMFDITTTTIEEDGETFVLYHTTLSEPFRTNKSRLLINFWLFAVFIKLLPCFILTIISSWLIRTLFKAKKRKQVLRSYDSCPNTLSSKEGRKRITTKSERMADRTTKMLVAVVILFLITEFPQGVFALCIGLKGEALFMSCYQKYGEVMDMMALLNGSINFILYCCMNRMFRTTFGQLFKPKLLGKLAVNTSEFQTSVLPNGTNSTNL